MKNKNKELKQKKKSLWKDETGDFGVKQIAITVAVIVLVAFIVTTLTNGILADWIGDIWEYLFGIIKDISGGA